MCRSSFFLILVLFASNSIVSGTSCYHGQPDDDESCVCEDGWTGDKCQHCTGRIIVGEQSGYISDGDYEYMRMVGCGWLIEQEPEYANRTLKLSINRDISCIDDAVQLHIFDGDGEFSPLLASYSGLTKPSKDIERELIASSGSAFLSFTSDGGRINISGYNITYKYTTNEYEVDSIEAASQTTPLVNPSWTRYHWQNLTAQGRGSPSVTILGDTAYIYSGQILGDEMKREQMLRMNTADFTVESIEVSSVTQPRFGHSAVAWQDSILVYGGLKVNDYSITNEFWKFNVTSQTWSELTSTGQLAPMLFGHTAHLVQMSSGREMMIVIFGFNPEWRYSNFIFQTDVNNIESNAMERVNTNGAIPQGTFGHASALDPTTKQIYVLGGWKYNNDLKNDFYVYQVETSTWKILHPIPSNPRYLHSMIFMNGTLLVYGGRRVAGSADCQVMPFESYETGLGSWKVLNDLSLYPRFGHSAIANESSSVMSLYGGFDGIMHSDVLSFEINTDPPDACENLTAAECENSPFCAASDNETCTSLNCTLSSNDCTKLCESLRSCTECLSTLIPCCQCTYSQDCFPRCSNVEDNKCNGTSDFGNCWNNQTMDSVCQALKTCSACKEVDTCYWDGSSCKQDSVGNKNSSCSSSISLITNTGCLNCTLAGYTWCETTSTCLVNADLDVLYPYGTCTDIRSSPNMCSDPCLVYTDCDACHRGDLACGWCAEDDTGLGLCMSGTFDSPLTVNSCNGNWSYRSCPDCQCNGHSTCVNDSVCYDCDSGTTGNTCNNCLDGFYGNPVNGVNCSECQCNGHAETCDINGSCDCDVYGVLGDHCESCRVGMSGNAVNSTCYYNIESGFRYQFQLPSSVSKMNFAICPRSASDLLLTVDSGGGPLIDESFDAVVTFNNTGLDNETVIAEYTNTTYFQLILRDSLIHFGGSGRTCVHIYMTFEPSITFYVQLEEVPFNIILLIAIVAAVFLVLLLAVAIVWKLHSMWLRYNRRRQRQVELQVMAARPYACIDFDVSEVGQDEKNATHFVGQSVNGGGETVGSILLWVPFGNDNHEREPAMAVGTALVKSKAIPKEKSKRLLPGRRNQLKRNSGFDNPVMDIQTDDIERNPTT